MKKIGIIAAMDEELALLLKEAGYKGKADGFIECTLEGKAVVLAKCGIGKVNAALMTQRLISECKVDCIINTGIAGAMEKSLNVLDIVVSNDAVYHDFDVTGFGYKVMEIPRMKTSFFKADDFLIENALCSFKALENEEAFKGKKILKGRVASGDQFICDTKKKDYIQSISGAYCVEMEGAAIAHTCHVNNIPYVIIRCMSDKAEEDSLKTEIFNEKRAGKLSAQLVLRMLGGIA